jgi:hypothetical protein
MVYDSYNTVDVLQWLRVLPDPRHVLRPDRDIQHIRPWAGQFRLGVARDQT